MVDESGFAEKGDVSALREKIPWDTKYGWLVRSIQYCTQSLYLGRVLVISKILFLHLQNTVLISMIMCYNKNKEAIV